MKLSASLCRILLAGVAILLLFASAVLVRTAKPEEVTALPNSTTIIVRQHDPGALRDLVLLCRHGREQPRDASTASWSSSHADAAGEPIEKCTEVE